MGTSKERQHRRVSTNIAATVCTGYVVWSTKDKPTPDGGSHGCGIRLTNIGVTQMRQLAEFVDKAT